MKSHPDDYLPFIPAKGVYATSQRSAKVEPMGKECEQMGLLR